MPKEYLFGASYHTCWISALQDNFMCIKFQVEEIVAEKIQTTIVSYRDNVDLQVLIDGVQQEVCLSLFSK